MAEPKPDSELLKSFALQGDEAAFRELVNRHADLVFGTAFRKLQQRHDAEEVAQNVFNTMALKAARLTGHAQLTGWLYQTTLLEARQFLRGELRRRRREQLAQELGTTMKDDESTLQSMVSLLDEGMEQLRSEDRDALLLRFLERRPLREVGEALGTTEDTAQKRVARALEALTHYFRRRGFAAAGATSAAAVLNAATLSAPEGFASVAASVAVAGVAGMSMGGLGLSLAKIMTLTKTHFAAACLLLTAAPALVQFHALSEARQNETALVAARDKFEPEYLRMAREQERLDRRLRLVRERVRSAESDLSRYKARKNSKESVEEASYARWEDSSVFVRVPKRLSKLLSLTGQPAQAGRTRSLESQRAAPINPDGTMDPILSQVLVLSPEEQSLAERLFTHSMQECAQQMAGHQRVVNVAPPGFDQFWMSQLTGKPRQLLCTEEFSAEGKRVREQLEAGLTAALGAGRASILFEQSQSLFRDEYNDFGRRSRLDVVEVTGKDTLAYWRQYRRNGKPDQEGSRTVSGGVPLEFLPERLRSWVVSQRPATADSITSPPEISK